MRKKFLLLALASSLFACVPTHLAKYDIGLKKVERPEDAKEQYGKSKIIQFQEGGKTKYSFEDGLIKIIWLPTAFQFNFLLTNKTSHSIKIYWDEAVYVDESGISKRVIHSGVKLADRNTPPPPTVVAPGSTVSDMVFPADNVHYIRGQYGGWHEEPLFPNKAKGSITHPNAIGVVGKEELLQKAEGLVGKHVQVVLPIKIEDTVNEYIFSFSIDGYEITRGESEL